MANVLCSSAKDSITPAGVSAGVTGGVTGAGSYTLSCGDGNDTLSGGAGLDAVAAGAGNDLIVIAAGEYALGEIALLDGGVGLDSAVRVHVFHQPALRGPGIVFALPTPKCNNLSCSRRS